LQSEILAFTLAPAASQLEGTSNNTNNIHAFLILFRLLEVFPACATRTVNFPQITASRFDKHSRMAKSSAGFEFRGSSIAVTKGRPSGSLSVHPTMNFPSPDHSVAFNDVKRHIFGSQQVTLKLTSCLFSFAWL